METKLTLLVIYFVGNTRIAGTSTVLTTTLRRDSSCGSWKPYTEEKCLRVADTSALLTKQEADALCPAFAETEVLDDIPRLVTIKNERQQEVLKQFLFEELGLLDHVWLDADMGDDGIFRWNNESELYFSNLVEQNTTSIDRQCVQIESGQGIYPTGKWLRVNCRKRNIVVCEKTQVWPVAQLQNSFLHFKTQVERQIEKPGNEIEAQEKISGVEDRSLYESPCGDWTPYKDEKCVKLLVASGTKMKEDADIVCEGLKEFRDPETIPHLIRIKTEEKQKFLQQLLFENQTTFDHVWLGLELVNDTLLRWNDGTELFFTNWAKQGAIDQGRNCVQMESGEGVYESGQWVRTNCRKRNAVVCEKPQTWTVTRLQNILLSLKLDVERNRKQSEETLLASKQEAERKLNQITQEAEAKMSANRREVEQTIKNVKQEAEANRQVLELFKQETERKINSIEQEAEQKINATKQEAEQKINAVKQEAEMEIKANKAELERTLNAFKQETDGKIRAAEAKIESAKQETEQMINSSLNKQGNRMESCPTSFVLINHRCYHFSSGGLEREWRESLLNCHYMESSLLAIESQSEWDAIKHYLTTHNMNAKHWWIGATSEPDNRWKWVGPSTPFEFTDWCTGEPNNANDAEHCAHIARTDTLNKQMCWNDIRCSAAHIHHICKL